VVLEGNSYIEIRKEAGIYITMNPSGADYGGRSKLPENLKLLF
jgi:dynein heavy chain 2